MTAWGVMGVGCEIVDGHAHACGKGGDTRMQFRSHAQVQLPAEGLGRFYAVCLASFQITVNACFKVLAKFVDGIAFVQD